MPRIPIDLNDYNTPQEFYEEYKSILSKHIYCNLYKRVINPILKPYQKLYRDVISPDILNSEINAAKLICEGNIITNGIYAEFLSEILDKDDKFYYFYDEQNQWTFLNKLNTNTIACAYLWLHFLYDHCKNNVGIYHQTQDIFTAMIKYPDKYNNEWYNFLTEITSDAAIKNMIYNNYINISPHKDNIKKLIKYTSASGERAEKMVHDYLKGEKWDIKYVGGNGSIIDQYFSIDLVAYSPNRELKAIQIKKVEGIYPTSITRYNERFYLINTIGGINQSQKNTFNMTIYVTDRMDILGIERGKLIMYQNRQWEKTDIIGFPHGKQLMVSNPILITEALPLLKIQDIYN